MFKVSRSLDSPNIYIELLDVTLYDDIRLLTSDLYKEIIKFLTAEYIKTHGPALLASINEAEITAGLATLIAKALIKNVKEEETNG